ncbi:hypothetical protein V5799_010232 [Amblyomma americanum]|uniref:Peptidase S54 rhomboid domain-containing protein n=1 Tax=Amblyomma americanum TaxID=6943 RepID=A0AAQ4F972_AMBAM
MGGSMTAARKQKIWMEEIPYWTEIYKKLQRGDKAYAVELLAFLTPNSKCPASILQELNELVNENEQSSLNLEQFLLMCTSGRPASVRQKRFHKVVTAAANVYAGRLQRARLVRHAMVDYPVFLIQVLFFGLVIVTQIVVYLQYLFWCCPETQREMDDHLRFDDKLVLVLERKREVWRTVSFVLVTFNGLSLVLAVAIELLVCLPLSLLQSPWKIPYLYAAGAFTAAELAFICGYYYTAGASAAVYSVLWAHVVDIIVNYRQFGSAIGRVVLIVLYTTVDAVQAYYLNPIPSVGTLPHLVGVFVGCTLGLAVLRKNKGRKWEKWVYGTIKFLYWALIAWAFALAAWGPTY